MSEFARIYPNELSECTYTKQVCTLCVFGNAKTYNEAKIQSEQIKRSNYNAE